MNFLNNKSLRYIFILSTTILTIAILLLFLQYTKVLNLANKSIENIKRSNVQTFSENIQNQIMHVQNIDIEKPFDIPEEKRNKINNILSLFSGIQFPFIYIVAKDKEGKYRYIFDGSNDERGKYLQAFFPESDVWDNAWNSKTPKWKSQDTIFEVRVTYLYPIVSNKRTQMLIAFDFSAREYVLIDNTFSPIKKYLLGIAILLIIFIVLIYIFAYLFYQQRKKTYIDSLTGLYNRHYLNSIANQIDLDNISIAIIDLDHFKRINDTYGHLSGDTVLQTFSSRLRNMIRANDILIRYGGEEFLLFLTRKNNDFKGAKSMIKSIQKRLSIDPIYIDKDSVKVTASIGFNATPFLNRSIDDAIAVADKMLYIAKTSGRDKVEIYEENRIDNKDIFGPREVLQALNENRVLAYFQPIANAKTNEIEKYEALVRLIDKHNNVISPLSFLPHIKSNTAYRSMSKFMLEQALNTIDKHKVSISVNFDLGDFLDETLYELIYDTIKQKKQLANMLSIELLEDQQIDDFTQLNKRILKLQHLGVGIAIDDFGAGYSTFSYLLALNPNILKIDGFLIKRLSSSPQAKAIVNSIVNLCKSLNIDVVAEFVSDNEIKHEAIALGVDYLQGYAIGRSSPQINKILGEKFE